MKKLVYILLAHFLIACGFQVSGDNLPIGSGNVYNASGTIVGVPSIGGVLITVNSVDLTVDEDGSFSFSEDLTEGESFDISFDAPGAFNCSLPESIPLVSAEVENLEVTCECGTQTQQAFTSYSAEGRTGSSLDPFFIYTPAQFLSMQAVPAQTDWDKSFVQVCDLDLDTLGVGPIGNNMSSFTGTYDGQGFLIENVHMTPSDPYYAIFGRISGATIENIHLKNVDIDSFGYGITYSAALVGGCESSGVIENILAEDITVDANDITSHVAALVGSMDACTLSKVFASDIDVSYVYRENGGLVGRALNGSLISQVGIKDLILTSTAVSTGYHSAMVGRLSDSDITDTYIQNAALTTAASNSAGFIGWSSGSSNIEKSYIITSSTSGTSELAGVVGRIDTESMLSMNDLFVSNAINASSGSSGEITVDTSYGSISNSFYDNTQTCTGCSVTQTGGTAVSGISTLFDGTSLALTSWDFINDWCLVTGEAPELRNIPGSACN